MQELSFQILSLHTGKLQPLGPDALPSGIFKSCIEEPVFATSTGLTGDEQGDTRHHGGLDKAIHLYPSEHYKTLEDLIGGMPFGAVGENLSSRGLVESDVCINDIFCGREVILQLSQARQPCLRLNWKLGDKQAARRFQDSGCTGWYFRVLQEGRIFPGETFVLKEREYPDLDLKSVHRILYRWDWSSEEVESLLRVKELPASWRGFLQRRLHTGRTEDWRPRLGES